MPQPSFEHSFPQNKPDHEPRQKPFLVPVERVRSPDEQQIAAELLKYPEPRIDFPLVKLIACLHQEADASLGKRARDLIRRKLIEDHMENTESGTPAFQTMLELSDMLSDPNYALSVLKEWAAHERATRSIVDTPVVEQGMPAEDLIRALSAVLALQKKTDAQPISGIRPVEPQDMALRPTVHFSWPVAADSQAELADEEPSLHTPNNSERPETTQQHPNPHAEEDVELVRQIRDGIKGFPKQPPPTTITYHS